MGITHAEGQHLHLGDEFQQLDVFRLSILPDPSSLQRLIPEDGRVVELDHVAGIPVRSFPSRA